LGVTIEVSDPIQLTVYIDAAFGVHRDMKSHTGVAATAGRGVVHAKSVKQRLNAKSSCEAELIGVADGIATVLWLQYFLQEQGHAVGPIRLLQDNQSTIQLIRNGQSGSEATRHIKLKYYYITDLLSRGEVNVEYCETGGMLADVLTKPLQGERFRALRDKLLNRGDRSESRESTESVCE
jgi:hypothetical protein